MRVKFRHVARAAILLAVALAPLFSYVAPLPAGLGASSSADGRRRVDEPVLASPQAAESHVMRASGEGVKTSGDRKMLHNGVKPESVALAFRTPRPKTLARPEAKSVEPRLEPAPASWVLPLGTLEDGAGFQWLFFKDERRRQVFRLKRKYSALPSSAAGGGAALAVTAPEGAPSTQVAVAPRGAKASSVAAVPCRLVAEEANRYLIEIEGELVSVRKATP